MRSRLVSTFAVATLAAATLACEGRTSGRLITGPTTGARVRLVNALPSSQSLDFLVDGQASATGVPLGAASPYVSVSLGSHRLQARAPGSATNVLDFTRDLSTAGSFSLIPAPGLSQSAALFIADDVTSVAGQGKVRVIHVAAAISAVAVYVTSPTAELSTSTPVVAGLPFGTASAYVTIAPGTYRVRVTPVGTPGTVLLDSGNLTLAGGTVRSLLLTDALGGGLPTSLSIVSDAN